MPLFKQVLVSLAESLPRYEPLSLHVSKMGAVEQLFEAIGKLLLKLAEFIYEVLEWTAIKLIHAFCLFLGILSLLNPFYTYEGICILEHEDMDEDEFFLKCASCFFFSLHSLVSVAMTPALIVNPYRWSTTLKLMMEKMELLKNVKEELILDNFEEGSFDNRNHWMCIACMVIPDSIAMALAFIDFFRPSWGGCLLFHFPGLPQFYRMLKQSRGKDAWTDDVPEYLPVYGFFCAFRLIRFPIDLALVTPMMMFSLLTPTSYVSTYQSLSHLLSEYNRLIRDIDEDAEKNLLEDNRVKWLEHGNAADAALVVELIRLFWRAPMRMVLDSLCIVPAICAYISLIRSNTFLSVLTDLDDRRLAYLAEYFPETYEFDFIARYGHENQAIDDTDNTGDGDGGQRSGSAAGDDDDVNYRSAAKNAGVVMLIDVKQHNSSSATETDAVTVSDADAKSDAAVDTEYGQSYFFNYRQCTPESLEIHRKAIMGWRTDCEYVKPAVPEEDRAGVEYSHSKSGIWGARLHPKYYITDPDTIYYRVPSKLYEYIPRGNTSIFDKYDLEKRVNTLYYGCMAMADVLLFPLLVPLVSTNYRWVPVKKALESGDSFGFAEMLLVLRQNFFLLCDTIILLPLVPFLYVTKIRWAPVEAALNTDFASDRKLTIELYKTVITTGALFLIDCSMAPFIALLWVTQIRWQKVSYIINETSLSEPSFSLTLSKTYSFYTSVILSVMLLSLDFVTFPIAAFLFVTQVRWPHVWKFLKDDIQANYTEGYSDKDWDMFLDMTFKSFFYSIFCLITVCFDLVFGSLALVLFVTQIRWKPVSVDIFNTGREVTIFLGKSKADAATFRDDWDMTFELYCVIFVNSLKLCFDIALAPLALIVLLTGYRARPLKFIWSHKYLFHTGGMWAGVCIYSFELIIEDIVSVALYPVYLVNPLYSFYARAMLAYMWKRERQSCYDLEYLFPCSFNASDFRSESVHDHDHSRFSEIKFESANPLASKNDAIAKQLATDEMFEKGTEVDDVEAVATEDDIDTTTNNDSDNNLDADTFNIRRWIRLNQKLRDSFKPSAHSIIKYEALPKPFEDNGPWAYLLQMAIFTALALTSSLVLAVSFLRLPKLVTYIFSLNKKFTETTTDPNQNCTYGYTFDADEPRTMPLEQVKSRYGENSSEYRSRVESDENRVLVSGNSVVFLSGDDMNFQRFLAYGDFNYVRKIVSKSMAQVIFMIRDMLFLIPFGVVVGTLYRFIPFILDAMAKAGSAPITAVKPLFVVKHLKITFNNKEDPIVQMRLVPTEEHEAATLCDVQAQSIEQGNNSSAASELNEVSVPKEGGGTDTFPGAAKVAFQNRASGLDTDFFSLQSRLHVYGTSLWELVKSVFGNTASTIGQAVLPLRLNAGVGINIQEFTDEVRKFNSGCGDTIPLTWHLPTNNMKTKSIASKLKKAKDYLQVALSDEKNLDAYGINDLAFVVQLDVERKLKSTGDMETACLFRFCPSIYELADAVQVTIDDNNAMATLEYTWLVDREEEESIFDSDAVVDPCKDEDDRSKLAKVPSALGWKRFYIAVGADLNTDDGDFFSTDKGFVDNFAMLTTLAFIGILVDIFHLGCFCFTALAPWRMLELVYHFFRPLQELPYRHAQKILHGIESAESHLDAYVKELLPSLNATAKNTQTRSTAFKDRQQCNISRSRIYCPDDEKDHVSSRRYKHEVYWGGWASTVYIDPVLITRENRKPNQNPNFFEELENDTMKQYVKRRKSYKKHLEGNAEWFRGLAHYDHHREWLQLNFLHLLLFKNYLLGECVSVYQVLALMVKSKDSLSFQTDDMSDVERIAHKSLEGHKGSQDAEAVRHLIPTIVAAIDKHIAKNRQDLAQNMTNILKCYQDISNHCHIKEQVEELKATGTSTNEDGDDFLEKPVGESTLTEFSLPVLKKSKTNCLFSQPIATSRAQIRAAAKYTIRDLLAGVTLLGLLLTLVMATPLVKDLAALGSIDFRRYTVRTIVDKHMKKFVRTVVKGLRALGWVLACTVTVVSLLPFLSEVPAHLHSLDDIGDLAKYYTLRSLESFCDTTVLLLSPRTYYLILRSGFYLALVPAACVGEIFVVEDGALTPMMALWVGSIAWFAIAFGAVWATMKALDAGADPTTAAYDASAKTSVIFVSCLLVFFGIVYLRVFKRKDYNMPAPSSQTAPSFTYHQALALLTPFVETAQTSAIIVYYFWGSSPFVSTDVIVGNVAESGAWAARLFSWGVYSGGSEWYIISMNIAAGFGFLWVFMLTLPATVAGEDNDTDCVPESATSLTSKERAARIRSSPLYKSLLILLSRVCIVYLMAALLRPLSCIEVVGSDGVVTNVLSTAPDVICGGGKDSFASMVSIILLVYMLLTMISVGADDSDDLSSSHEDQNMNGDSGMVKFSPLYAFEVRVCQFFIVAACMGGFDVAADSPLVALGAIAFASVVIALAPLHHAMCCSWRPLVPMRSAGAGAVLWTTVLCILRNDGSVEIEQSSYGLLLIAGWFASFLLGLIGYYWTQRKEQAEWMAYLMQNGFADAITNLEQVSDSLLVQETKMYKTLRSRYETREMKEKSGGTKGSTSTGSGDSDEGEIISKQRHADFQWKLKNANSLPKLAMLIAEIEDKIILDRLDPAFCAERLSFYHNLVFYEGKQELWSQTKGNASEPRVPISETEAIGLIHLPRLIYATKILVLRISENDEMASATAPTDDNARREDDLISAFLNKFAVVGAPSSTVTTDTTKLTVSEEHPTEEHDSIRSSPTDFAKWRYGQIDKYDPLEISAAFSALLRDILKPVSIDISENLYQTSGHGLDIVFVDYPNTTVDKRPSKVLPLKPVTTQRTR